MKKFDTLYALLGSFTVIAILLTLRGGTRIVRFGKTFIGQEELTGNIGFRSETLQRLMEQIKWRRGDAWCVYFVKMLWYNMAPRAYRPVILSKVSGNSQQTLKNLSEDKSGIFKISKFPKKGSMVIWQYFKNGVGQWKGHAGIVTRIEPKCFYTIEGNTNISGGSEGYIVGEKERKYDFVNNDGLRLRAFISFS